MNILITGGAGYIGSFMVKKLLDRGDKVTVADNLKTGHRESIDSKATLLVGDLSDLSFVQTIFKDSFDAILHFAGLISMEESTKNPFLYFQNNTFAALNLIDEAVKKNIKKLIFSSTAGVYGNPIKIPIPEDHSTNPTNPYGESKLMVERILSWYNRIFGLNFVSLRYFNAAGASLDSLMGEDHKEETHIIPLAMKVALSGSEFNLYGTDYKTDDGTCVRDYIHVLDLVEAHVLALNKLDREEGGFFYNVGTGRGYSNKEVLNMVKNVSKIDLQIVNKDRRPGDADVLIADPGKAKNELGFSPKYSDLETIVKTAWQWHSKLKK